jgi:hypothetical protein
MNIVIFIAAGMFWRAILLCLIIPTEVVCTHEVASPMPAALGTRKRIVAAHLPAAMIAKRHKSVLGDEWRPT